MTQTSENVWINSLIGDVNLVLFTLGFPCCVFQLSYEGFDLLMQEEKKSQATSFFLVIYMLYCTTIYDFF